MCSQYAVVVAPVVVLKVSFMLLETARRALTRRNIKWLLTRVENHFESKQICFYSNIGKVFQLPEFQARKNYFSSEIEWVVLRETAS